MNDFEEIRKKAEEVYKTFDVVRCPYFKAVIHFNSQGIRHLKFKRDGQARARKDQYMRFKLLHLAPEVLRISATVQGIKEWRSFERIRIHNRTDTVMKDVEYHEFVAILKDRRVKVIVKRIENGQRFFWSLIPHWRMDENTGKRKMYSGNPEDD